MKKHFPILMISIFILGTFFSIAIAAAGENPLVNEVASKIKNNVSNNESLNESVKQGINESANESLVNQSQNANISGANEIPETGQKNFRISPTVALRPVNDVITENEDGILELYIENPAFNEMILNLDIRISIPEGIYVYGQNFSQASAANVIYGNFSLPPGSSQITYIDLKGTRTGNFTLYLSGLYWAGEDEEDYTPISLIHTFLVKAPSKNPETPPVFDANGSIKAETEGALSTPGFGVFIAMSGLLAVYAVRRK